MKRLIAISLVLLVAVTLIALAGCRKQEAGQAEQGFSMISFPTKDKIAILSCL